MAAIRILVAKNNTSIKRILLTFVRISLGSILLTAGWGKITNFSVFMTQIALYDVVPMSAVKSVSYFILSAEITLGLTLILGYFSRGASILSAGLFGIFIFVLALALWRNLPLDDCGCQNVLFDFFLRDMSLSWKVGFVDAILLAGCLFIAGASLNGYGMDSFLRKDSLLGADL